MIRTQKEKGKKKEEGPVQSQKPNREKEKTHTPPATPPATSDLQMLSKAWLGALTPSLASFASSARFTIVDTAESLVVFPTTSSDAIAEKNPRVQVQNVPVDRFWRSTTSLSRESEYAYSEGTRSEGRERFCFV